LTTHILLACSKSKSLPHNDELTWTSQTTLETWKTAWGNQKSRIDASKLYTGRILKEQIKICKQFDDVKVYIISAGAGLIHPISKKIPSYEATFQDRNRVKVGQWCELPEGGLENLSLKAKDTVVCFAPPSYQRAMKNDPQFEEICSQLTVLSTSPLANVAKHTIKIHPRAKEALKLSSRDLNTELTKKYFTEGEKGFESLYKDCLLLPTATKRRSVDDEELRQLISAAPESIKSNITKTVQYIRHECLVSSIDTRIRRILLEIRNSES
jgi:hypothetical protein